MSGAGRQGLGTGAGRTGGRIDTVRESMGAIIGKGLWAQRIEVSRYGLQPGKLKCRPTQEVGKKLLWEQGNHKDFRKRVWP